MSTCVKRLRKEGQSYQSANDDNIKLISDPENIMKWLALLKAPTDSVYNGFCFYLDITVPDNYPLAPPKIYFRSKIFHPNVLYSTGEICLDILKKEWSPAWSLQSAVRAISALLADPAADSPLNCDAGNMVRAGDVLAFSSTAKMLCQDHALPEEVFQQELVWL